MEASMSKENEQELLDYSRWNSTDRVIELLNIDPKLDLLYREGKVFRWPVDEGNIEMLTALIEYYKKHKLNGDKNSAEYLDNLDALHKVMDEVESRYEITDAVREVIGEYLSEERQKKLLDELDASASCFTQTSDVTSQASPVPDAENIDWNLVYLIGETDSGFDAVYAH